MWNKELSLYLNNNHNPNPSLLQGLSELLLRSTRMRNHVVQSLHICLSALKQRCITVIFQGCRAIHLHFADFLSFLEGIHTSPLSTRWCAKVLFPEVWTCLYLTGRLHPSKFTHTHLKPPVLCCPWIFVSIRAQTTVASYQLSCILI